MRKTIRLVSTLILILGAIQAGHAANARTVLIFPFTNQSSRADLDWISEGLAQLLASRLASPDRYILGREERNAAYAQLELPPDKPLTLASDYKVADILDVDWAVMGNFNVVGTRMTVRASFLDVRGMKLSAPIEATGELSDMVELQTDLAWRLLAAHDPEFVVGSENDFRHSLPEVHLDAFENYIRGILSSDDSSRVRFLTEADRRNPRNHQPAFQLGRFYFDRKDYARADIWLRKVQDGDSNYLESLFLLGDSEYFLGQEGASEKTFKVLSLRIPLNEVSNNLGVMESRRNDYADALTLFERAHQADPTDPDFSFNMGVCLWYLKRYQEANQALGATLAVDDEDIGAHTLLASVSGKLGDKARQQREQKWVADHEGVAISESSDADILPQTRIKKHYDGHAFRLLALTVKNELEKNLARKPAAEHASYHLAEGQRLLASGRAAEAAQVFGEAVSLVPDNSEAHMDLGRAFEAEGKNTEAATELEMSLKLKESVQAHLLLAHAYLALNRDQAASAQCQAALNLEPGNREAVQLEQRIQATTTTTRR